MKEAMAAAAAATVLMVMLVMAFGEIFCTYHVDKAVTLEILLANCLLQLVKVSAQSREMMPLS